MKHLKLSILIAVLFHLTAGSSIAGLISPKEKPNFKTTQNNYQIYKDEVTQEDKEKVKKILN